MRVEAFNNSLYISCRPNMEKTSRGLNYGASDDAFHNYNNTLISGSNFISSYLIQNNINFGATRIKMKTFPLTKYRSEIRCPCCGEKMKDTNKNAMEKLSKEIGGKKGEELSCAILKNMNEFQASKRNLAKELANAALKNEDLNVSELLDKISDPYLESLKNKQLVILNNMTDEIKTKSKKAKGRIKNWKHSQEDRILYAKNEGEFKNANLMNSYITMLKKLNINISNEKIQNYYQKLPNSRKDIDAFVVKYKRKAPDETIFKMLKDTRATIEHIVPFSKTEDNSYANLLIMCNDCNSSRENMEYKEFLTRHPEMKDNIKKYYQDIERILTSKTLDYKTRATCKNYLTNVKKTLYAYTGGKIGERSSSNHHRHRR